ncbi:putative ABC transport system permease protein [Parapedobacter koreensis]|uniref:Putative ABC transport system permease protein n=2 Tax=Parapedobacter koreensis TaxID=332977 RepID=A0A1H7QYU1_9SPHI|nr:putative ABC transport system permease protein [Parapedobacter koreensis]
MIYFKTACRSIWNNRKYTALNTIGLSLGLAVFITVLVYVNRERSYDRWDDKLEQVYRVNIGKNWGGDQEFSPFAPPALGYFMRHSLPEVETATTLQERQETVITIGNEQFYEKQLLAADSLFFSVFPYRFRYGQAATALAAPQSVVISEEMSKKWFGDENPVGKTLKIENSQPYTITGVFQKMAPSHLNFNLCVSSISDDGNWWASVVYTYTVLKKNTKAAQIAQKITDQYTLQLAKAIHANPNAPRGENFDDPITSAESARKWLEKNQEITEIRTELEQVSGIHLQPTAYPWRDSPANHPISDYEKGNHIPVVVFSLIAIAVLFLACINYVNLAVAQGHKRAKESGLRKVIGASRGQLVFQFLLESFIQVVSALCLGILFSQILIHYLNTTFGLELQLWSSINAAANGQLVVQLCAITLMVSLLAGGYPALLLSSYRPVRILKGELASGTRGLRLRNVLVIVQFSIAVAFVTSLFIMNGQVRFMQRNDPGFDSEQVLRINGERVPLNFFQSLDEHAFLMNSLRSLPEVESVATTHFYPGQPSHSIQRAAFGPANDTLSLSTNYVGLDYFETVGTPISQGRDFSTQYAMDSVNAAIINETTAKALGVEQPVGQQVTVIGREYTIIGVVKDSYGAGYTTAIRPEIYVNGVIPNIVSGKRQLLVRLNSGRDAQQAVEKIAAIWKTVDGSGPMRYSWLDDEFSKLMEKHVQFSKLTSLLTLITLAIAIMGIFALSTFAAQQRTKEIGIRKVLGASVAGIVGLLSKDFVKLVLIAIVIASPIAWWAMNTWLEDFAYRIDMEWWMFAAAGLAALVIALATVSWQAIRAAVANPVDSLRDE